MFASTTPLHPEVFPRLLPRDGLQVREDALYSNHKGEEKKGIRKRAEKTLGQLGGALQGILETNEVILYVAAARREAGLLEQMTMGYAVANVVTMTTLVFTNLRLLHFRVKRDGRWNRSLRSLQWGDVATAKVSGWLNGRLKLTCRNGTTEKYWGLIADDRRKIKVLVAALLPASQGDPSAAQSMRSLCPQCRAPLTAGNYSCAGCGLGFKDESSLFWRSLIPGGVYFFTGHPVLAVFVIIGELYLLLLIVLSLAASSDPEMGLEGAIGAAVIFAFLLLVEKLITIYHGRKFLREFIPSS